MENENYFDKISDAYGKYYSPAEHLAGDEVIVLFRGRIIFKQYIPNKHNLFGMKVYKLCDSKYMYRLYVSVFR
jgi:hypothetical protein